jgi:hypothetical protein
MTNPESLRPSAAPTVPLVVIDYFAAPTDTPTGTTKPKSLLPTSSPTVPQVVIDYFGAPTDTPTGTTKPKPPVPSSSPTELMAETSEAPSSPITLYVTMETLPTTSHKCLDQMDNNLMCPDGSPMVQQQHLIHDKAGTNKSDHDHGQGVLYDLQQHQRTGQGNSAVSFRVSNPFSSAVNVYVEVEMASDKGFITSHCHSMEALEPCTVKDDGIVVEDDTTAIPLTVSCRPNQDVALVKLYFASTLPDGLGHSNADSSVVVPKCCHPKDDEIGGAVEFIYIIDCTCQSSASGGDMDTRQLQLRHYLRGAQGST